MNETCGRHGAQGGGYPGCSLRWQRGEYLRFGQCVLVKMELLQKLKLCVDLKLIGRWSNPRNKSIDSSFSEKENNINILSVPWPGEYNSPIVFNDEYLQKKRFGKI